MKKLRIGVIDLVSQGPTKSLWSRVMNANLASIMPQVIAVWCKRQGHEVSFLCYTGLEDLTRALPANLDLVFIGAFTESAQLAYALSNRFHARGVVTVLGGPHARCFPQDSVKYFDYVLGFTDEAIVAEVLQDCARHTPVGLHLSANAHPAELPGIRDRWEFISATISRAPVIQFVPMIATLGCPYTCSFCIDSTVPYQVLDTDVLQEDLRFLVKTIRHPIVGWHDPNFGVRFEQIMGVIEEAVPPGSITSVAESSLSLLTESRLRRLQQNGFKALLPGIESWFDLGEKTRASGTAGMEKVKRVAEHVNLVLRYIPYVQTNFVLGLDSDFGPEPFELTRRFVDLTPGAFPGYSLLTSFGEAAPINLEYQRDGRVIGFPFHFLNNNGAMNVRPKNYSWPEFYRHVVETTRHSFSPRAIVRRLAATKTVIPKWMNVVRAISTEGYGRIRYHSDVLRRLEGEKAFRDFYEQRTDTLPAFFEDRVRSALGYLWDSLPEGALRHDPNAYLKAEGTPSGTAVEAMRRVA